MESLLFENGFHNEERKVWLMDGLLELFFLPPAVHMWSWKLTHCFSVLGVDLDVAWLRSFLFSGHLNSTCFSTLTLDFTFCKFLENNLLWYLENWESAWIELLLTYLNKIRVKWTDCKVNKVTKHLVYFGYKTFG